MGLRKAISPNGERRDQGWVGFYLGYFMCLRVLPACMYVCTMCMSRSSEDGVRTLRTGVGIVVEATM